MAPRDDGDDRQAILARRAIFVTTALAALGCSSQSGQGTPSATVGQATSVSATASASATGSALATATGSAGASAVVPATAPDPAARKAAWDKLLAAAPPLDVSKKVPKREQPRLEQVKVDMERRYQALAKIYVAAPVHCGPKDASCAGAWKDTAAALADLKDDLRGSLCGGPTMLAEVQRTEEHETYLRALIKGLEDELGAAAAKHGAASEWQALSQGAVKPTPCLKCAMPEVTAVLEHARRGTPVVALFDEGKSTLAGADAALDKVLERLGETGSAICEVRGHSDLHEPGDGAALAKARAEAVRDALVKKGADKKRLLVISYSNDLPIASSASEAGRAKNRRVDFEVLATK